MEGAIEEQVAQWDQWFATVGMAKEWATIKDLFPDDPKKQLVWAGIIEMNRISAAAEKAAREQQEEI